MSWRPAWAAVCDLSGCGKRKEPVTWRKKRRVRRMSAGQGRKQGEAEETESKEKRVEQGMKRERGKAGGRGRREGGGREEKAEGRSLSCGTS